MIPHPRASLGLQLNPGAPGPRPTDPPERRRASLEQAISILFLIALHSLSLSLVLRVGDTLFRRAAQHCKEDKREGIVVVCVGFAPEFQM